MSPRLSLQKKERRFFFFENAILEAKVDVNVPNFT